MTPVPSHASAWAPACADLPFRPIEANLLGGGIYVLVSPRRRLYVGRSGCVAARIASHRGGLRHMRLNARNAAGTNCPLLWDEWVATGCAFDRWQAYVVDARDSHEAEREWIDRLQPELNVRGMGR